MKDSPDFDLTILNSPKTLESIFTSINYLVNNEVRAFNFLSNKYCK